MQKKIDQAVKTLKQNGIVVYPTDTAYAIGCKFKCKKAIAKILKIKNRQDRKFTLVASSQYQVEKYFKLNFCQKKIAKKYWPGPVSIVVSKSFSVRVPANKIARTLARRAGQPLLATSFNKTGEKTIYDLKESNICRDAINRVPTNIYILDIGPLTKRKTSTIVECCLNKTPGFKPGDIKIIRHGSISADLSS